MADQLSSRFSRFLSGTPTRGDLLLTALLVVATATLNAWVCDDAYITFRVVDNFTSGYGLRWNVFERVQAYTNPLWLFLVSAFYLVTNDVYFTSIGISLALVAATVLLIGTSKNISRAALWAFTVLLVSSKSFIDFTSSGLENPLLYFLVALFYRDFLFSDSESKISLRKATLIASLAYLTRPDGILFFVVPTTYLAYHSLKTVGLKAVLAQILLGSLPAITWTLFSLLYYGFPFPNTAYAKLAAGIPSRIYFINTVRYWSLHFRYDAITPTLIALTSAFIFFLHKRPRLACSAATLLLYQSYTALIGGDFLFGRFFSVSFLLAVLLLAYAISRLRAGLQIFTALVSAVVLLHSLGSPFSPLRMSSSYKGFGYRKGVNDEKGFYKTWLMLQEPGQDQYPDFDWLVRGYEQKETAPKVSVRHGIGMYGFAFGPDKIIVDSVALSDPLLARLPYKSDFMRIGHLTRQIPEGYLDSLASQENKLTSPVLREYYDHLRLITQAPIFSLSRLKTILSMNTGKYEPLVRKYIKESYERSLDTRGFSRRGVRGLSKDNIWTTGMLHLRPLRMENELVPYLKCRKTDSLLELRTFGKQALLHDRSKLEVRVQINKREVPYVHSSGKSLFFQLPAGVSSIYTMKIWSRLTDDSLRQSSYRGELDIDRILLK